MYHKFVYWSVPLYEIHVSYIAENLHNSDTMQSFLSHVARILWWSPGMISLLQSTFFSSRANPNQQSALCSGDWPALPRQYTRLLWQSGPILLTPKQPLRRKQLPAFPPTSPHYAISTITLVIISTLTLTLQSRDPKPRVPNHMCDLQGQKREACIVTAMTDRGIITMRQAANIPKHLHLCYREEKKVCHSSVPG